MPGLIKSWTNFKLYSSCNLDLVENLARNALHNSVKHFIQISTSSVYGSVANGAEDSLLKPVSPYGVTKLAAEELIKSYSRTFDLNYTILRYFSVYGPRQRPDMAYNRIISSILKNKQIEIYGDGNQTRTNTYISDCISATISTIKLKPLNEIINISGTSYNSLLNSIDFIQKIIKKEAKIVFKEKRPGDQLETRGDISKAKKILNFIPKVELFDGLKEQIAWQKSTINDYI